MEEYAILTENNDLEFLVMLTHTGTTSQPELSGNLTLLRCKKKKSVKTVMV